jgi:2-hydroxy-3-keto-5-methylthiopentenyl-1-phosphate phosphatase
VSERKLIIFCDFDGTITENDNIVAIMKHFNPDGWEQIVKDIMDRKMSIQQGVGKMFALFPTDMEKEVKQFAVNNAVIRKGFSDLLSYSKEQDIDFLVTSGGIDFFVYPLLEPFAIDKDHIFCNGSDFSGETMRITWPHACDEGCPNQQCGMCKTKIIRSYSNEHYHKILIGDSVTDLEGAKLADLVFARAHLIDLCKERDIATIPFEDFNDVIEYLKNMK